MPSEIIMRVTGLDLYLYFHSCGAAFGPFRCSRLRHAMAQFTAILAYGSHPILGCEPSAKIDGWIDSFKTDHKQMQKKNSNLYPGWPVPGIVEVFFPFLTPDVFSYLGYLGYTSGFSLSCMVFFLGVVSSLSCLGLMKHEQNKQFRCRK